MSKRTIKIPKELHREGVMSIETVGEKKSKRISISSNIPYKRYDWMADEEFWEVLSHEPGGIDDSRLKLGLPVLFNHSRNSHLGRSTKFNNDGARMDVGTLDDIIWSESEFAQSKKKDVENGALVGTSVGYAVLGDGERVGEKDGLPIYKFKWQPHEFSFCTIEADTTVGAGRERAANDSREFIEVSVTNTKEFDNQPQPAKGGQPPMKLIPGVRAHFLEADKGDNATTGSAAPAVDVTKERGDAITSERKRVKSINDFVGSIKDDKWKKAAAAVAIKSIEEGEDFETFRTKANNAFPAPGEVSAEGEGSGIEVIGERQQDPRKRKLSLGEQFVRSEGYKASRSNGGARQFGIDIDYSILGIRGKVAMAQRAGWVSSDLAAVNVTIQNQMIGLGLERLTIMDLLSPGTISTGALIYPRENSFGTLDGVALDLPGLGIAPKAGMVGEGGLKPEWLPDLTTETAAVKKVAVTTKVPDEFLADFSVAQSYINERLPYMVDTRTEEQLLYGDGTGNNLKGITTNAGIQTRAIVTTDDSTIAASLKKGLTDVSFGSLFEPTGFGFHPYDWETAQLLKDDNKRFLAGGPYYIPYTNGVFMEVYTFWGKPVVVSSAVKYGRPLAGAWKLGAQYFMREGMRLEQTISNEDDFRRNLVCIRAEHRLTLATYRPSAFIEFTGFPARAA